MKKNAGSAEQLHLAMLLSVLGGMMDGYSYAVRGGVFATGQTGNLVILAYSLMHGQYSRAFRAFVPILGFWCGIFAAQHILSHFSFMREGRQKGAVLFLEAAALLGIGFVPASVLDIIPNTITALLAAMQFSAFRKFDDELAYASVFCTGNMRAAAEYYYSGLIKGNRAALKRALQYTGILLSFLLGALAAMGLGESLGTKSIWLASIIAVLCGALLLRKA